jgi:hypothetical protein
VLRHDPLRPLEPGSAIEQPVAEGWRLEPDHPQTAICAARIDKVDRALSQLM